MELTRRALLGTATGIVSLGLAGCGGTGDDEGTPTETDAGGTEPTATPTESPTSRETETPTESGGTGGEGTTTDAATDTRSETPTDEDGTGTPPTESPTATPTETPTPTEVETPTPPQADQNVEVGPDGDFRFDPEEFEIAAGETVRWVWRSSGHNVKPESTPDGSDWSGTEGEEFNTFSADYEYTYTFETPGTYEYVCKPHESAGMTGSFTVTE